MNLATFKIACVTLFRPQQLKRFLALQFMFYTLLIASMYFLGAAFETESTALMLLAGAGVYVCYQILKESDAIEI